MHLYVIFVLLLYILALGYRISELTSNLKELKGIAEMLDNGQRTEMLNLKRINDDCRELNTVIKDIATVCIARLEKCREEQGTTAKDM
jgi:hypothetical protein